MASTRGVALRPALAEARRGALAVTPELAQFQALVVALGLSLVLAMVAVRRSSDNRWRQVGRVAALALVVVFVLLLAWLAQLAAGEPF